MRNLSTEDIVAAVCALLLALTVWFTSGCAAKKPVQGPVVIKDCRITEYDGATLSCECPKFVWELDAKTGRRYARCLK